MSAFDLPDGYYEDLRTDERVQRAEQEVREYLGGDAERVFTEGFTKVDSKLASVRLRVAIERRKREAEEAEGYEDNSGDPRGFNLYGNSS